MLERKEPEYEINASKEHTESVIKVLREEQTELIRRRGLDAKDYFSRLPEQEVLIKDLLPTQPGIDHPHKFCFVANRPVLNEPIVVAKIGGISALTLSSEIRALSGKMVIIDGHTRAAVKLAEAKDRENAKIKAIVLVFPNAASFFKTFQQFSKDTDIKEIKDLIPAAKYQRGPSGGINLRRKHPAACPGIKRVKK